MKFGQSRIRAKTERHLSKYSSPTVDFFVLISLSSAVIALGLLLDNTAIVIGGMVLAPLLTPIFGFSLGLLILQLKQVEKSLISIVIGILLTILVAAIIGLLTIFVEGRPFAINNEIISRLQPDLLFFLVAFFSGLAGAFAYARPNIMDRIAGVAISVALIPPLSVVGLGISLANHALITQSLILFGLNLTGIICGSLLMFVILGFGKEID